MFRPELAGHAHRRGYVQRSAAGARGAYFLSSIWTWTPLLLVHVWSCVGVSGCFGFVGDGEWFGDGGTYAVAGVGAADLLAGAGAEDVRQDAADGEEAALGLAAVVVAAGALDVADVRVSFVSFVAAVVAVRGGGGGGDAGGRDDGGDDLGDMHGSGWVCLKRFEELG